MLLVRTTGITEPIGTFYSKVKKHKNEERFVVIWAYEWQNPGPPLNKIWKYTSYCVQVNDFTREPTNGLVQDGSVIELNAQTIKSIKYHPLATRIKNALEKEDRWENWQKGLAEADRALFGTMDQTVKTMVALIREEIAFSFRTAYSRLGLPIPKGSPKRNAAARVDDGSFDT
jgi:hypothetical protein